MYLSSMDGIFSKSFPVPRGAIDGNGHVNNIAYVQWMQDVAIDHTSAAGWPPERYFKTGAAWVARSHFVEYLRPAFENDPVTIHTWVAAMEKRSCPRHYLFLRDSDRVVLARARTVWVYVDLKTGRGITIPEEMRAAFAVVADEQLAEALGMEPATVRVGS